MVSEPFSSSVPMLSRPTVGSRTPSTLRAKTSPITANCASVAESQSMLAPRSSITLSPRTVGTIEPIAGPADARQRLERELGQRHERAGVARRDHAVRRLLAHGVDGEAHARALAPAQRLDGLVVVGDHLFRIVDGARGPQALEALQAAAIADSLPKNMKRSCG